MPCILRRFRWYHPLAGLAIVLLVAAAGAWFWLGADLPSPHTLYQRAAAPTTKIFDRKGKLLYEVLDPHGGKHSPVPLDEIPLALRQATIATEDASFYSNPGVDFRAILRAVWINLKGGDVISGGSTITQQLARNLLLSPDERGRRTLSRKLRETILAFRIGRAFSKDEILSLYLNEMYYGNLAYGVESASQAYYGKHVRDLSLAECALLAGLPQSPSAYDPLVDPEAAHRRQSTVLDLMVKAGYATAEDAEHARQEPLHYAAVPFPIQAPHFVMHVRRLLEDEYGLEGLYRGGLQVHTTLDLDLQNAAQEILRRQLARLTERSDDRPLRDIRNGAVVAMDPRTGEVLTMLGSPDYFDPAIDGAVNGALSTRQPGSSIKPITYAAALGADYTPATLLWDVRTSFQTKEGEPYVPYNYDRTFHGPVLLRDALASSYNLVAVKVLDHVGLKAMTDLARRMGITTFDDGERFGLSLTLGGGEVRLSELTAAYAAFATGGRAVEPVIIDYVDDSTGRRLYTHPGEPGEQVLDPRAAYLITDILSDDNARMSGFGRDSVLLLTRPAAVKTGTTTDWRDNWTVGYTPDLVVGVWVGNADNKPMGHVSGVTGAAPVWHEFVDEALMGKPALPFERPPGLVRVEVCAESGLLPGPDCARRKSELFLEGHSPDRKCDLHERVGIDRETGQRATANCPPEQVTSRVFTVWPAEAADWARERRMPQPPAQACVLHPDEVAVAAEASSGPRGPGAQAGDLPPLVMTSPDQGSSYRLSPAIPLSSQCIEVAARPGDGVRPEAVELLVDGASIGRVERPPYRQMWCLKPGAHAFQARGAEQDGRIVESPPVYIRVQG